ncbi:hypothetical protein T492DRAFT_1053714 [Pavlovales sp. CCMP2436]|nr:hypothetical protein T492DRAFT_1053714 [Pavlovales sp. CCMP2436]
MPPDCLPVGSRCRPRPSAIAPVRSRSREGEGLSVFPSACFPRARCVLVRDQPGHS